MREHCTMRHVLPSSLSMLHSSWIPYTCYRSPRQTGYNNARDREHVLTSLKYEHSTFLHPKRVGHSCCRTGARRLQRVPTKVRETSSSPRSICRRKGGYSKATEVQHVRCLSVSEAPLAHLGVISRLCTKYIFFCESRARGSFFSCMLTPEGDIIEDEALAVLEAFRIALEVSLARVYWSNDSYCLFS